MKEVNWQMAAKNKRRAPEMTTKQGKLKADRKAKLQRIYLDDLASLENFSIVTDSFDGEKLSTIATVKTDFTTTIRLFFISS